VALRNELLRLERLEQLAYKFERKVRKPNDKPKPKNTKKYVCFFFFCSVTYYYFNVVVQGLLRDGYLKEMIQVLSDPRYGSNLTQVEATVKKHEAICADILSRVSEQRCWG
jgi:spectrin beta